MKYFVLGLDTATNKIVHIENVKEGYLYCVCEACRTPLIAANRNQVTRKNRIYFKHANNDNCSQESALHRFAKEIIHEAMGIILPEFNYPVVRHYSNGSCDIKTVVYPSKWIDFQDVNLEKGIKLDDHYIIPDVTGGLITGSSLYVEIYVTSDKKTYHREIIRKYNLNTVEVDLSSLKRKKYITKDQLRNYVLNLAPRKWLHIDWYDEEIACIKHELESLPDKQPLLVEQSRPDTTVVKNKRKALDSVPTYEGAGIALSREVFNQVVKYMRAYRDVKTRRMIAVRYANSFWRKYSTCHILDYCDVPIKGELAFNKYRTIWQEEVIDYLEQSNVALSATQITDYVVTQVSLNKLARLLYEHKNKLLPKDKWMNLHTFVSTYGEIPPDYIPCPYNVINQYLSHLDKRGIIMKVDNGVVVN